MSDLISRADAIEAVCDSCEYKDKCNKTDSCVVHRTLSELPSADAEPTVIRSKTLMPTNDFKEWTKRIKEENPNVIVIPCDAEVVSADAVHGEWQEGFNEDFGHMTTCSNCGEEFCDEEVNIKELGWHYCPNCGARMKGGDTE